MHRQMRPSADVAGRAVPPTRRVALREVTRGRIIDAAIAVIAERGYAAATIDEISRRAKVGRTTVYKHFHGKSDIVDAINARHADEFLVAVAAMRHVEPGRRADLDIWLTQFEWLLRGQQAWHLTGPLTPEALTASLQRMDRAAGDVLEQWATLGWRPAVAAPAQALRLLFNLVGRWVSYHAVFGVAEPEHSRAALIDLLDSELQRIVRRHS